MDPELVRHGLDVSRPPMRQRLSRGWHAASYQRSIYGSGWQTALRQQYFGITGAATLYQVVAHSGVVQGPRYLPAQPKGFSSMATKTTFNW